MTEAVLTGKLLEACRHIMEGAEALKHSDRFNAGYPDATVTWNVLTSWLEVKLYNDEPFKSPPIQKLQCRRLAAVGSCYYVIYVRVGNERHTRIVPPSLIDVWDSSRPDIHVALGFNHTWVANFIRNVHLERMSS